jgi:cytochrome c oxidase subunit 3
MSTHSLPLDAHAAPHSGDGHGHVAHGHHDPNLQHHFTEMPQQYEASKLGMWLFLATEILMFGGLFVAYGLQQAKFPEAFKAAHHHLDWQLGALNTIVLLVSSFTMVLGVWAAQTGRQKTLITNLVLTLACAGTFMVVKYFEYSHKFHDGLLLGRFYSNSHGQPNEYIFFSFYFMMTGLHGIHVLVGMGLITWLIIRASKGAFGPGYYTPVDLVGLYWHLVDMIWIYLFPLLYLIS